MSLNTRHGINLKNLVDAVKKYESVDSTPNKEKILIYICKNLLRTVQFNKYINNKHFNFSNKKYSNTDQKRAYVESRVDLTKMIGMMQPEAKHGSKFDVIPKKRRITNYDFDYNRTMKRINASNLKAKARSQQSVSLKRSSLKKKQTGDESDDFETATLKKRVNFKRFEVNSTDQLEDKGPDNYLVIKAKQRRTDFNELNENNLKLPLNVLKSRVTNISKKHVTNFLSTGYNLHSPSTTSSTKAANYRIKARSSNIYLVNNPYLQELLETPRIANFDAHAVKNTSKSPAKCSSDCSVPIFSENYLTRLYLFVKLLYLLSSVVQFLLLTRLIGNGFHMIGIDLIKSFFYEIEWPHLVVFPRMTLCEIYIREIGVVHPYLIQCVLSINLFNEVIFIIIWYWLLMIITLTSIDLLMRFLYNLITCSNCRRKLYALKYLELIHMSESKYKQQVKSFVNLDEHVLDDSIKSHSNYMYLSVENHKNNFVLVDGSQAKSENSFNSGSNSEVDEYDCVKPDRENAKEVDLDSRNILIPASKDEEYELFEQFCSNFNNDTIFALNIIQQNASSLIVSEIVEHLWIQFKRLNFVFSSEANDYLLKKIILINE